MRKEFLFIVAALTLVNAVQAQTRGTKVGYIDMEYILQNVPDYAEAQSQLEQKAQKWKQEVETKKIEINKLKEALKAEKALLTKGLIEERTAEIAFLENENLEYQQKRFGPNGDLMTQKAGLTKPIQDQVFSAVQDIAESKKYDFIFDKTSDLTMLFAAKRFDISDQIVRVLNRTEKREQLTKKQLKEEEAKEAKEDAINDNPALSARQQSLDAKKAARDAAIADRLALQEQRKQAAEEKRLQIIEDREAKRNGTAPTTAKTATTARNTVDKEEAIAAAAEAKQLQADERAKTLEIRKQAIEDKKRIAEERRLQILADRQAKKTGAIPASSSENVSTDNTAEKETSKIAAAEAAAEAKQLQADERAKTLEIRKQALEDKKRIAEEKRLQILADREAKKTDAVPATNTEVSPENVSEKQTTKTAAAIAAEEAKQKQADARAKALEDRKKIAEDNKKALEEKRKQAIEAKEAKKTGTVSESSIKEEAKTPEPDTAKQTTTKTTAEEAKQKQADAKAKTLEERNKIIEERKNALEEKRKKILEDRAAAKKAQEEKLKTTKENTNNN